MVRQPTNWKKRRAIREVTEQQFPITTFYPTRKMLEVAGWKKEMTKEEFVEAKAKLRKMVNKMKEDTAREAEKLEEKDLIAGISHSSAFWRRYGVNEDRLLDEWLKHEEAKPKKPRRKAPDEIWH